MTKLSDLESDVKSEDRHIEKPKVQLAGGGEVTPEHRQINPQTGQQKGYIVLAPEERAKGFVRPVRCVYTHVACGQDTRMSIEIAETYARDPKFYNGTFCSNCRDHFPLNQFVWQGTNEILGS